MAGITDVSRSTVEKMAVAAGGPDPIMARIMALAFGRLDGVLVEWEHPGWYVLGRRAGEDDPVWTRLGDEDGAWLVALWRKPWVDSERCTGQEAVHRMGWMGVRYLAEMP